ncbi:MAG: histidine phosphatase family protein [Pseudomonadota bacterium]
MRTLILLRHAKAVRAHEAPNDEARGLTARGERDAGAAGAAMEDLRLKPTLALVSPAIRTRQTAARALQNQKLETRFDEALYHASPEGIWDAFSSDEAESVIVIGHNPGLGELASILIAQAHDGSRAAREFAGNFPTCAFVAFEIRGDLMQAAGPRLIAAWKPPRDDD